MIRNNICMNAHPEGCNLQVKDQIDYVLSQAQIKGAKRVLVIGASTGYGLASRIVPAIACNADTIGVSFEREGSEKRSATAGWYNTVSFDRLARERGLYSESINGDAFSNEIKNQVSTLIKENMGTVDLVIYSLASPVRTDPDTGETYRSVLKPIGESFASTSLDAATGELREFHIEPATEEEIAATVKVMGGEDWARWIQGLADQNLLAKNAKTVAYSYIGPPQTQTMYRHGTIGRAKEHLENTAKELQQLLDPLQGNAYVSVNKAMVTRASAVIPVVPLYISILFKVMKAKGIHENCIHQVYRLFQDRLYGNGASAVDGEGRIRMDDLEMRDDVQAEVKDLWARISSENLSELADFDGYWEAFLSFHGFGVAAVNYDADVEP